MLKMTGMLYSRVKNMREKLYFIFMLLLYITIFTYQSLAQEEKEIAFPISNTNEIITQSGVEIDPNTSTDGEGSLLVNSKEALTVELFELDQQEFGNKRLTYKAKMRSEDLVATKDSRGIAYIELLVKFPDGEELISRGPRVPISGTTDWSFANTVLYIDKAGSPKSVNLNLVVEGEGKVWIDDIRLEVISLRLNYLFWGHVVVWVVLIIYIYSLLRKNKQLKKELETV